MELEKIEVIYSPEVKASLSKIRRIEILLWIKFSEIGQKSKVRN